VSSSASIVPPAAAAAWEEVVGLSENERGFLTIAATRPRAVRTSRDDPLDRRAPLGSGGAPGAASLAEAPPVAFETVARELGQAARTLATSVASSSVSRAWSFVMSIRTA